VLQVGHLERFSAAHAALSGRLGPPLYIEAVRVAPFKPRGTDVSVILDLMIHDLDLVLALMGSPIESVDAVGAAVASPHEDIANARIRFVNGAVATITASRVSPRTERRMRIFARDGTMAIDFANRRLTVVARDRDKPGGQPVGHPVPGVAGFGIEETSWEDHDSLAAEHAAFIASVLDGASVVVDAAAGRRALDAALRVMASIAHSRGLMEASGLLDAPAIPVAHPATHRVVAHNPHLASPLPPAVPPSLPARTARPGLRPCLAPRSAPATCCRAPRSAVILNRGITGTTRVPTSGPALSAEPRIGSLPRNANSARSRRFITSRKSTDTSNGAPTVTATPAPQRGAA
jgi:hypothetical protein